MPWSGATERTQDAKNHVYRVRTQEQIEAPLRWTCGEKPKAKGVIKQSGFT